MTSMLRTLQGAPWKETRRLYGALAIESTENGIEACNLKANPYSSQKSSLTGDHWLSTLTPPGAISHTHMDHYGSMQYFTHIEGKKLWLLWPPTPQNLSLFSAHHKQRATDNCTLDCIHGLEGLQLLYLDDEETTFVLKPNTLHACLSFTQCVHTGVQVWDYELFDSSFVMMEWGLKWIKSGILSDQPRVALEQEIGALKFEIIQWETLIKQNRKETLTNSIQKKVKALKHTIYKIVV